MTPPVWDRLELTDDLQNLAALQADAAAARTATERSSRRLGACG